MFNNLTKNHSYWYKCINFSFDYWCLIYYYRFKKDLLGSRAISKAVHGSTITIWHYCWILTGAAGWLAPPRWGTWVSPPPPRGAVSAGDPPASSGRRPRARSAPLLCASTEFAPNPGSPAAHTHKHIHTQCYRYFALTSAGHAVHSS